MDKNEIRDPHIKIFNFKLTPYIGVGKSLFLWFLAIAILPLIIVSYINYINAFEGLTIVAEKTLVNSSKLREENLNLYFNEIEKDLNFYSDVEQNKSFFIDLQKGYRQSGLSLREYTKSNGYQALSTQRLNYLSRFNATHQYYDVLFADVRGNVLFSLKQNSLFATNVYDGDYSNTQMGKTLREILETGSILFSDFEHDNNAKVPPSGIIGKPVYNDNGNLIGAMAFRIL
ncbi:MAG TPA: hypothetical protein VJ939_01625, partial [Bacteroidales bacterium]|nr:hypothetical protein [Bacteroidales bacterium]